MIALQRPAEPCRRGGKFEMQIERSQQHTHTEEDQITLLDCGETHRYSADVLAGYEDDHFDWIYIDGNHRYEPVLADLRLARAKVKPGGLITGDDYDWRPHEAYPVKRAVADFVEEAGLEGGLEVLGSQFLIVNS